MVVKNLTHLHQKTANENDETETYEIWGLCGDTEFKLGIDFAIVRTKAIHAGGVTVGGFDASFRSTWIVMGGEDKAALSVLCKVRAKDYADLHVRLQKPLQIPLTEEPSAYFAINTYSALDILGYSCLALLIAASIAAVCVGGLGLALRDRLLLIPD